jgi:hypothetical protein
MMTDPAWAALAAGLAVVVVGVAAVVREMILRPDPPERPDQSPETEGTE